MNIKQHTIKKAVTVSGVGLHTGVPVNMTSCPPSPATATKFNGLTWKGNPR
jgi:UDP-3-O-[3-hydroxymyristoyl] N-acetylglucosamine deacetylase/3-hydroxyacyl-[acyl-carrier-protein] dehydratase